MRFRTVGLGSAVLATAALLLLTPTTTGEQGDRPTQLRQVDIMVTGGCTNGFVPQKELCLGGVSGKSACYGDSGGPSVRQVNGRWELTGATSRAGQGRHPCQSNTASIYSSVPAQRQSVGWVLLS